MGPVFASVRAVLGDEIFLRLHPDWRTGQEEAVRSICTNDERDVYVAVAGARPVGFVAVALKQFLRKLHGKDATDLELEIADAHGRRVLADVSSVALRDQRHVLGVEKTGRFQAILLKPSDGERPAATLV
ncbi:MAG TPA: hypothetical protein VHH31_06325 [Gaiellaceae bacterium]|nr:hypothetical protein [Gaiellaceae bacterium]